MHRFLGTHIRSQWIPSFQQDSEYLLRVDNGFQFQRCLETYQTSMRCFIKAQKHLDPSKLEDEHNRIAEMVSHGLLDEEHLHVKYLLDELCLNMVEHEERQRHDSGETLSETHLCIYLTRERVYVVGYSRKLGAINIHFGNANGKPGFAAVIRHNDGILAWSEDYDNLTRDKQGRVLKVSNMETLPYYLDTEKETLRKLTEELFMRLKECVEKKMKETISQVMLVVSSRFNSLEYRKILRNCCIKAGFKRVSIETDPSFMAIGVFTKLQQDAPASVLVVTIRSGEIIMHIFGGEETDGYISGAQLLACARFIVDVCDIDFDLTESMKSSYKRALAQLPIEKRHSIRYFEVLNECNDSNSANIVDEVFQHGEKLTKSQNILPDMLKEVFSNFCRNYCKIKQCLDVPSSASSEASTSSTDFIRVTSKADTLKLWIHTLDGNTIQIIAFRRWTVKRLKEEYMKSRFDNRKTEQMVIKYGAEVLNDYRILGSYKLDPDSVLQVTFGKATVVNAFGTPNLGGSRNTSKNPLARFQLTGNCIAEEDNLASECRQCRSRKGILNYYKIDLNSLSYKGVKKWKLME